jgi:hypothetical protein
MVATHRKCKVTLNDYQVSYYQEDGSYEHVNTNVNYNKCMLLHQFVTEMKEETTKIIRCTE